jgi:hypothetical protein
MRNRIAIGALAAIIVLPGAPALAQDLYIGTVDVQKNQVILTRCDLTENRYVLRDRNDEREKPVANLRERLKTLKAPVYVEVFGQYVEQGEDNALDVIGLENIKAGKSCHLADVLPSR